MERPTRVDITAPKKTKREPTGYEKACAHLPEFLPPPDWVGFLYGPPRSGKSYLMCQLILRKALFRGLFENIVIISPTAANAAPDDPVHALIHSPAVQHYEHYSDALIQQLIETQAGLVADAEESGDEPPHMLIVADDMVGELPHNGGALGALATRYRHHKISLLIATQTFRELPVRIRTNLSWAAFFKPIGEKEAKKLGDEYAGTIDNLPRLLAALDWNAHEFLYVNFHRMEARKGLTEVVMWKAGTT